MAISSKKEIKPAQHGQKDEITMELELAINGNEVLNYQRDCRDHICSLTYVRQSELAWITEQIVSALSAATRSERRDRMRADYTLQECHIELKITDEMRAFQAAREADHAGAHDATITSQT